MSCDKYLELLTLRLDGELSEAEDRELEAHLAACPDCQTAGAQLAALQSAFAEWEDISAPEGFVQGVMDRIQAEESGKKIVPLFKRPQIRALAGLAACAALVIGLYSVSQPRKEDGVDMMPRSFSRDAADISAQESLGRDGDGPRVDATLVGPKAEDAPQIAAYTAPNPTQADVSRGAPEASMSGVTSQKTAPNPTADSVDGDWADAEITLILDRLPQGAEELLPPEVAVVYDEEAGGDIYTWLTVEELAAIEELAFEQGLIAGTSEIFPSPVGARCALIVRRG